MFFAVVIVAICVILGEVAVNKAVAKRKTEEMGKFSGHAFDVIIGVFLKEYSVKLLEEARDSDFVEFCSYLQFFAILLIAIGSVLMAMMFFELLSTKLTALTTKTPATGSVTSARTEVTPPPASSSTSARSAAYPTGDYVPAWRRFEEE